MDNTSIMMKEELRVLRTISLIGGKVTPVITFLWKNVYPHLIASERNGWIFSLLFFLVYFVSWKENYFTRKYIFVFSFTIFSLANLSALYFAYVNNFAEGYTFLLTLTTFSIILMIKNLFHLLCYQGAVFLLIGLALYHSDNPYINPMILLIAFLI